MTDESPISWTPLEPGQLPLMWIKSGISGFILLLILTAAGTAAFAALPPRFDAPLIGLTIILVAMILWNALIAPPRRYRRWGYCVDGDELHVAQGVFTHVETTVAFHRVQHIDVAQGPLERACKVCRLQLNTAGTAHARITLPGLSRETAEALRDKIRSHIRADAA